MTRYFKQFWPSNLLYLGLTTIISIQTIFLLCFLLPN